MSKICIIIILLLTSCGLYFVVSQHIRYKKLNDSCMQYMKDKEILENEMFNSIKINNLYIGDLDVVNINGEYLKFQDIPSDNTNKLFLLLRPTDCSICVSEVLETLCEVLDDHQFVVLTTNKNITSTKLFLNKLRKKVQIYNLNLIDAWGIVEDKNAGPVLFQVDRYATINNFFNARKNNNNLLNKYLSAIKIK